MLVIDKKARTVRFILTLSEKVESFDNVQMEIVSPYSNTALAIGLTTNISTYPTRYDEFQFPISTFESLKGGKHLYNVKDGSEFIERGVLMVLDNENTVAQSEYISIEPDESDDDYLVLE